MPDPHITDTEGKHDPSRPQFRLRTLLLITTATCVLLGITLAIVPESLPFKYKIFTFLFIAAMSAYAARMIYLSKHRPWKLPDDTVAVQVDAKWLRRVKSPFIMGPIAALTGVSLTFAPMCLLWCGQMEEFGALEWVLVPVCFLVIYVVPGFYMSLASEVLAQLVRLEKSPTIP
jgi:hypothetical protein